MINLTKDNISLRALEPEDINILYQWENNTEIWEMSNTLVPISKYVLQKYLKNSHLDIYETQQLRLVIQLDLKGEITPIGAIDIFDFDPIHKKAGIGILINDKENRNKGYAGKALDIVIEYAFHYLKLHHVYCNITIDNEVSIKLFQSRGFEIRGEKKDWLIVNGKWTNEYFLQLINPI